ncbi:hypothetical protein [Bacteroides fragilis]|jgi:hypothetical protein|uniref:hypothetical protein n=1 Tax=Bacteroides fragilis TaxID=817 RepID=UPI0015F52D04|nr:hypothetical protein [Bacteroides fragilis]MBA5651609.1 hypothetical protein [Bacteroides fragilis]MCE9401127.1 hypothetical protein [Bacteroides fragilis]MCE9471508.1 hypothetical protein [Bacteroides fragilis]MCZ2504203.1 hypothetical protein [Bacteroides fragilis]
MRKWTYLVAALLVGGATTTFTGCIDNDEPAGIEQLRGAKAEFIKAKAAFEDALTQIQLVKVEREQVALEADKVALDLQKLNLEKEQASTAWLKDSLQARQDTLAASLKEQLLAIQKKEADTNADLQASLAALEVAMVTAKDEAFGEAIKDVKEALAGITKGESHTYGALDYLKNSNARLLKAKSDLLDFLSDNKYLEDKLNAGIDEAKAALATQEKVLEDMKTFAATPTSEWNTKLAEISKQIAAVNADVVAKSEAIAKQTAEIQPVLADIEREKAKLNTKDKSFTIPVVDAALQNDLAGFVQESSVLTSDEFNKVFKRDGATGEYTMIADLNLSGLSLNNYYEATSVVSYIRYTYSSSSSQNVGYIQLFNNAYNSVFSIYRNNTQPTDAEIAKAKGELARMAIDKADKYAIFQKDSTAWMDSYLAYMTALTNYKNYQQTTTWDAIAAKVNTYKALAPAEQTKDKANALLADLKAYGQLRDAVDGATGKIYNVDNKEIRLYNVTIVDDSETPTGNQVTLSNFNSTIQSNAAWILGSQQLATSFYNSTLSDFDGAIQRLILASNTLFGKGGQLTDIIEPKKVGDKYYLPEDVEAGNHTCSYYLYTTAMKDVAIFTNIEKWIALDNSLTADLEKFDDAKKTIADNVATLQAGIADKQDAIWKAELERQLLDYNQSLSSGNPYSVSNSSACQIQALNSLMTTIQNAITNGGQVTYVTYDPVNHKFETVEGTIEKLISDQESKIATAKDAVATAEGKLEAYKTLGKDDKSRFESDLQTAITNAEQEVAFMQAEVDRLNATLKKLLDAYAAE